VRQLHNGMLGRLLHEKSRLHYHYYGDRCPCRPYRKGQPMSAKHERVAEVNALIKTISDYGRRFFFNERSNRVAHMFIGHRGHLYFVDDYSGVPIYVAYSGRWSRFSHGGTLRNLVDELANYVRTGAQLSIGWIGPERFDDSNIWGYAAEEMAKCRAEAAKSPVIAAPQPQEQP
jgi:hypothetical protein